MPSLPSPGDIWKVIQGAPTPPPYLGVVGPPMITPRIPIPVNTLPGGPTSLTNHHGHIPSEQPAEASIASALGYLYPESYISKLAEEHTIPTNTVQLVTRALVGSTAAGSVYRSSIVLGPRAADGLGEGTSFATTTPYAALDGTKTAATGYTDYNSMYALDRCTGMAAHVHYIPSVDAEGIAAWAGANDSTNAPGTVEACWDHDINQSYSLAEVQSFRAVWHRHHPNQLEFSATSTTGLATDSCISIQIQTTSPHMVYIEWYLNLECVTDFTTGDFIFSSATVFDTDIYEDVRSVAYGAGLDSPSIAGYLDKASEAVDWISKAANLIENGMSVADRIANMWGGAGEAEELALLAKPKKGVSFIALLKAARNMRPSEMKEMMELLPPGTLPQKVAAAIFTLVCTPITFRYGPPSDGYSLSIRVGDGDRITMSDLNKELPKTGVDGDSEGWTDLSSRGPEQMTPALMRQPKFQ